MRNAGKFREGKIKLEVSPHGGGEVIARNRAERCSWVLVGYRGSNVHDLEAAPSGPYPALHLPCCGLIFAYPAGLLFSLTLLWSYFCLPCYAHIFAFTYGVLCSYFRLP